MYINIAMHKAIFILPFNNECIFANFYIYIGGDLHNVCQFGKCETDETRMFREEL